MEQSHQTFETRAEWERGRRRCTYRHIEVQCGYSPRTKSLHRIATKSLTNLNMRDASGAPFTAMVFLKIIKWNQKIKNQICLTCSQRTNVGRRRQVSNQTSCVRCSFRFFFVFFFRISNRPTINMRMDHPVNEIVHKNHRAINQTFSRLWALQCVFVAVVYEFQNWNIVHWPRDFNEVPRVDSKTNAFSEHFFHFFSSFFSLI